MISAGLAIALAQAAAPAKPVRSDAPPIAADRIILVGDSTMAPGSGWASAFCAQHVKSTVACLNLGRGGRSTRSYRQEGSWALVLEELGVKGYRRTYVLIQFGHNDQSSAPERWTDLATEFPANLRRYVSDVRAAGGIPVLVTPLSRREFKGGKLQNTLAPWADSMRRVATDMNVPLADLNADSAALIQKMGAVDATTLAMLPPLPAELAAAKAGTTLPARPAGAVAASPLPATGPTGRFDLKFDYTHVGPAGAELFSRLVANELALAVPDLRAELIS